MLKKLLCIGMLFGSAYIAAHPVIKVDRPGCPTQSCQVDGANLATFAFDDGVVVCVNLPENDSQLAHVTVSLNGEHQMGMWVEWLPGGEFTIEVPTISEEPLKMVIMHDAADNSVDVVR